MSDERDTTGSERRVYSAAGDERPGRGRPAAHLRTRDRAPVAAGSRNAKRTPALAVAVLIAIAIMIVIVGVAARNGGLAGSENDVGTFKLLPITTTTTS